MSTVSAQGQLPIDGQMPELRLRDTSDECTQMAQRFVEPAWKLGQREKEKGRVRLQPNRKDFPVALNLMRCMKGALLADTEFTTPHSLGQA